MPRMQHLGLSIAGAFVNTIVQSQHALHEFLEQLSHAQSGAEAYGALASMSNATFLGLLAYLFLLGAVWLPMVLLAIRSVRLPVSMPAIGIGAFGTALVSIMDVRYAFQIYAAHAPHAHSLVGFALQFAGMDAAVVAGVATSFALVIATWVPIFQLMTHSDDEKPVSP